MDFLTRVTLTTLTACTVLGTTSKAPSSWLRLDFYEFMGRCRQIFQERERDGSLAESGQALQSRIQAKERIALDLAAGRLSLPQAASRFGALSEVTPNFWYSISKFHPSATRDERLCRYLIDWTESLLEDTDPSQVQAVGRRLTADLNERLRRGEPLVAP
jgi:hypothetical protein